jgi:hypothetical protein
MYIFVKGDYFRFGSVFIKKIIKLKFFFTKNKTSSNRPVSVRFDFFGQKPVWLGLARFGLGFFLVFFIWVRFSSIRFFRFQTYKIKTEPVSFFKILINFFHGSVFSVIFFQFNFSVFRFFFSPLRFVYLSHRDHL